MTTRGLVMVGLVVLLLGGCARPGTGSAAGDEPGPDGAASTRAPASTPAVVMPTVGLASCVNAAATVPSSAPSSASPSAAGSATASGSAVGTDPEAAAGEQFERNNAANDMFRQRRPMPPLYVAAAQPCLERIRAALQRLRERQAYDVAAVEAVLREAGLSDITVRPPGRLDLGSGDGVVFGASSGVGCIFGAHGPRATTADFGSAIADGGCLVAPG